MSLRKKVEELKRKENKIGSNRKKIRDSLAKRLQALKERHANQGRTMQQPHNNTDVREFVLKHKLKQIKALMRKDKNVLLIPDMDNMVTLEGRLAQNYSEALQTLDHEINLERYTIARDGYSPEAAAILGEDYLGDCIVITTPAQECAPLIRNSYSYMKHVLDAIFVKNKDTIDAITVGEALIGKVMNPIVEQGVSAFFNSYTPGSKINLSIEMETPNNAISAINLLKQEVKKVYDDPDLMLCPEYVEKLKNMSVLKRRYGNLNAFECCSVRASVSVDHFKICREDIDLYLFVTLAQENTPRINMIYFNKGDSNLQGEKLGKHRAFLNGKRGTYFINNLHDINMLGYEMDLLENRIMEWKRERQTQNARKTKKLSEALRDVEEELPEELQEYERILEGYEHSADRREYFKSLDIEHKMKVIYPMYKFELFYEVLTRANPQKVVQMYGENTAFLNAMSKAEPEEQKQLLRGLKEQMRFTFQNRPDINLQLMQRHSDVCDELGIRFVKM